MSRSKPFALFAETSRVALIAGAALVHALTPAHAVITRDDTDPPEIIDTENAWNAIGFMITSDADGGNAGVCTGSLVNHRFFLTAAHCLNGVTSDAYGVGGTQRLGVSFDPNIGAEGANAWVNGSLDLVGASDVIYEPTNRDFFEGDLAVVALDAPMAMDRYQSILLSPAEVGQRVTIVGYGRLGTGTQGDVSSDYFRRVGQNRLGSTTETWANLGVPSGSDNPYDQPLLAYDFDDPTRAEPSDFYPDDATTEETMVAPGDSGGPLIISNPNGAPLQIGVASGILDPTPEGDANSNYGDLGLYQPLADFAEWLIDNNPLRYFNANAGDGSWTDPDQWTETQETGFYIRDGEGNYVEISATDTPDYRSPENWSVPNNSNGDEEGASLEESDALYPTDGGVYENPYQQQRPARYYDVLFGEAGRTTLSGGNIQVDRVTIANAGASLRVDSAASLNTFLDTMITAGELNVNGVYGTTERLLNMGGVLSGDGTVTAAGGVYAMAGQVSPGNSIGTLTINGDYVQLDGAALVSEIGATTADLLDVNGTAMLDGELVLERDGSFVASDGRMLTVLTSEDLVPDANDPASPYFDIITNNLGSEAGVFYTSTDVIVTLGVDFQSGLETGVQQAVGAGLSGLGAALAEADAAAGDSAMTSFNALLDDFEPLTDDQKRAAYDALAPRESLAGNLSVRSFNAVTASHISGRTAALRRGGAVQAMNLDIASTQIASSAPTPEVLRAATERALRARPASRMRLPDAWGAFVTGDLVFGDIDAQTGTSDEFLTGGVTAGLDRRFGNVVVGLAGSYANGTVDTATGGEQTNTNSVASLYVSYSDKGFYADGYASYGISEYETERTIPLALANVTAEGDTDGEMTGYGLALGYTKDLRRFSLTGEVAYRHAETVIDSFTETGGGIYNLNVQEQTIDTSRAEYSLEASRNLNWKQKGFVTPFLRTTLVQEYETDAPLVIASFEQAPTTVIPLAGLAPDDMWMRVGAGVAASAAGRVSGIVRYDTDVMRDDLTAHRISGAVRVNF